MSGYTCWRCVLVFVRNSAKVRCPISLPTIAEGREIGQAGQFRLPLAGNWRQNGGMEVEILFEDEHCLVANKPSGVLTQAPPGIDSMEVRVRRYLKSGLPEGQKPYLALPHRLDRPASGALLFAKKRKAARRLGEQFEGRLTDKRYWVVVAGRVVPPQSTWQDFMRKIPDVAQSEIVPADHPDAQQAVLHYRVIEQTDYSSWLEIQLETGRTHQIRLQTSSRGHPILGDALYGSTAKFGPDTPDERLRAIALHARELTFRHPRTEASIRVDAPLPKTWDTLAAR